MKKFRAILAVMMILVIALSIPAAAQGTGKSYVYNHNATANEIPDPYKVTATIGYDLGMVTPVDMVIRNEKLYILDTGHGEAEFGNTRLLVLDAEYNLVDTVYFKNLNGSAFMFNDVRGLWIDDEGKIYICDRLGHMVYVFDKTGVIAQSLPKPQSAMVTYKNEEYLPMKILTDHLGIIYVQVENDYRGIIMMEQDGTFLGYFGSNEVSRTLGTVFQQIIDSFRTEAQEERTSQTLPSEYSNFCIDEEGAFIYGVRGTTDDMQELIRKINCKSNNVLEYKEQFGDISLTSVGGQYLRTNFNAITVDEKGFITAFDSTWQRLFQYTPEGTEMYVFGGKGTQEGTFTDGTDLESWGDKLLVLDEVYATVTVLEPTTFGYNVRLGESYYHNGDYAASMEPFQAVVTECMNYEFGYRGIGKAYYMQKDYKAAMDAFYLAHDQDNYSMAFKMHRGEVMNNLVVPFLIVIALVAVFLIVRSILKKKGIIKEKKVMLDEAGRVKYVLHTMIHPIDGYDEMRYNQKHSMMIANIAVFFFFFSSAIRSLYSGFIFNGKNAQNYNVIFTIVGVVGALALFVLVNWLMSTFQEGKGTLRNVWIYMAYATIPYTITTFLYTLLSNMLTADEATFLSYLQIFGFGWAIVMAVFAIQGVHMYTFGKTIVSILVTILGMIVVLFIVFLMFNLFVQFFSFVESIATEVAYRQVVGF